MIRRFDEVLTQKTSKVTMIEEIKGFDEKMALKLREVYQTTDKLYKELADADERLD